MVKDFGETEKDILQFRQDGFSNIEIMNLTDSSVQYIIRVTKKYLPDNIRGYKHITEEQERMIYNEFLSGEKIMTLCQKWHISASTVADIRKKFGDTNNRERGKRNSWSEAEIDEMRAVLSSGGTVRQLYNQFAITKAKLKELGVLK